MNEDDLRDLAIISASTAIAISSLALLKKLEEDKGINKKKKNVRR